MADASILDLCKPIKKDTKKRQRVACDSCRSSKKKCDGLCPCSRCSSSFKICTYTTRKEQKKPKISLANHLVTQEVTNREYIDNYFQRINPLDNFFHEVSRNKLYKPESKSVSLQYNAAMATATRAWSSDLNAYHVFQNRARKLASELFDDFNIDTLIGYQFLAFHYWTEDIAKCFHYREIALSMCRQLLGTNPTTDPYVEKAQFMCLSLNNVTNNAFVLGADKVFGSAPFNDSQFYGQIIRAKAFVQTCGEVSLDIEPPSPPSPPLDDFAFWIAARSVFSTTLFKSDYDKEPNQSPLHKIDEKTARMIRQLLCLIPQQGKFRDFPKKSPEQFAIHILFSEFMAGFVDYASGSTEAALNRFENVFHFITEQVISIIPPPLVDLIHVAFRICYVEKKYQLANRFSGVQRTIAARFPSTAPTMNEDMDLLKQLANVTCNDRGNATFAFSIFHQPSLPQFSQIPTNDTLSKNMNILTSNKQDNNFHWDFDSFDTQTLPLPLEDIPSSSPSTTTSPYDDIWAPSPPDPHQSDLFSDLLDTQTAEWDTFIGSLNA